MEQSSIVARRLWQVVRAVFYMLRVRGGISKKKLMLDFHLFIDRGKIVGKSFIYQLIHHHHNYRNNNKRYMNNPRNAGEVEFSCSNTPAAYGSSSFHLPKRKANKHQNNNNSNNNYFHNFDVKEIARALEALNGNESPYVESPMWSIGKSPAYAPTTTNHLRITDSPFPVIEEDDQDGGYMDNKEIDMEAEEFIRKFYEQLRSQQSVPATPVSKRRAN